MGTSLPALALALAQEPGATSHAQVGQALVFWFFAALTLVGAIVTITRKSAVVAVMCLVATLISIAVLYVLLYAHFLAVIQVLVYAGAVMVLFVFVVMILNKEEEAPWALRGWMGKLVAVFGILYCATRMVFALWRVRTFVPEVTGSLAEFGSTRTVGRELFSSYLFPFEAVSLVLLVAVVGALVLGHPFREARRIHNDRAEGARARGPAAPGRDASSTAEAGPGSRPSETKDVSHG